MKFARDSALIVVHPQYDFFYGGTVPVARPERFLPRMNRYIERAQEGGARIVVARDWHPWNHCEFFANGGLWMRHCVQGEYGAQVHDGLRIPKDALVVSMGTLPEREPHSVFEGTLLNSQLRPWIYRLFFCGLEADEEFASSVWDALFLGYEPFVLSDAVRSRKRATRRCERLRAAGVRFLIESDFARLSRECVRRRH